MIIRILIYPSIALIRVYSKYCRVDKTARTTVKTECCATSILLLLIMIPVQRPYPLSLGLPRDIVTYVEAQIDEARGPRGRWHYSPVPSSSD